MVGVNTKLKPSPSFGLCEAFILGKKDFKNIYTFQFFFYCSMDWLDGRQLQMYLKIAGFHQQIF